MINASWFTRKIDGLSFRQKAFYFILLVFLSMTILIAPTYRIDDFVNGHSTGEFFGWTFLANANKFDGGYEYAFDYNVLYIEWLFGSIIWLMGYLFFARSVRVK